MPDFRNTVGSGTIILYPSTLLNICLNCNSLSVNFSFHFGFYMYTDMPSVNTIVWCLPFQFLYFSPFSLPHGTGWDLQCNATMVMVGVSIFISFLLRGRLFNILPLSLLFSVGFWIYPWGDEESSLLFLVCWNLIMNWHWILSIAFSAFITITLISLLSSVNYTVIFKC